jgi:ankyrin repeat protein
MPSSLRKALNELPATLDDTYERALQGIPKEQWQHAHRLFQCLVAAIRPLRVEELGEMFAMELDSNAVPNLVEGWRPENPEATVLSACSSLIVAIEDDGSRFFHFSHFSVKEFLTSDRLRTSEVGNIRHYHISLDDAHVTLARACLAVLLQFDDRMDKKRLAAFPFAFYAARHWVDHAKFGDITTPQIQVAMERLFDPSKPYLASWTWIHDVDRDWVRQPIEALPEYPSRPGATALYYAILCGFTRLGEYLVVVHSEDVNARCGHHGSALHAALYAGHLDAVGMLLDHGADVNLANGDGRIPLVRAYDFRNLEAMRLLLERGANADVQYGSFGLLSHHAAYRGRDEVVQVLLQHNADVNARCRKTWTPLHWASAGGHTKVAQLLLEYGADVDAQSTTEGTPLHQASRHGHLEVVQMLLSHGADVHVRGESDWTPFQMATFMGRSEVAQLLLQYGAEEAYEEGARGIGH